MSNSPTFAHLRSPRSGDLIGGMFSRCFCTRLDAVFSIFVGRFFVQTVVRPEIQLVHSLSGISRTSHCDVCQIEFDAEFDKSVELKFAVNQAIRPRQEQTFCLAGPAESLM